MNIFFLSKLDVVKLNVNMFDTYNCISFMINRFGNSQAVTYIFTLVFDRYKKGNVSRNTQKLE